MMYTPLLQKFVKNQQIKNTTTLFILHKRITLEHQITK